MTPYPERTIQSPCRSKRMRGTLKGHLVLDRCPMPPGKRIAGPSILVSGLARLPEL